MATTNRCYPPGGAATTTQVVEPIAASAAGATNPPGQVAYSALINASVDVPYTAVPALQTYGWQCPDSLVGSGTTANRPGAGANRGKFYADTTLAAFIWSDGAIWRTFAGAAA